MAGVRLAEAADDNQLHPSLFVDTKYWIRSMEFGARENWRNQRRPCTLLERIAIDEDGAVISLGDNALGSLESVSVRQLVLASNGQLLLERDTLESEDAYIKFLNESGNCFDSSTLPDELQDQHWFRFQPDSDRLSWFNAANWASALNQEIAELVPDSHQIPCGEDVVVFGSRHVVGGAAEQLVEADERWPVFAFRVNFRPSQQKMAERETTHATSDDQRTTTVDTIRVSKLKIGDKSYSADEFDQLVRLYGDDLFYFDDPKSIFSRPSDKLASEPQPEADNTGKGHWRRVLAIDESSIQATDGQEQEVCLDEAGCLCGNEQVGMMDIICSFNQALEQNDMLCLDPIRSAGYCNQICATSITINMTPVKFSERFLSSLVTKLLTGEPVDGGGDGGGVKSAQHPQDYFADHIFVGSRRIDQTKYEITLRLVPASNEVYSYILGRDLELGLLIKQHLEKAAIKSFYGIRSISLKSSVLWRANNRGKIFWLALIVTVALSAVVFVQYDDQLTSVILTRINIAKIASAIVATSSSASKLSQTINDELLMSSYRSSGLNKNCTSDNDIELDYDPPGEEFSVVELGARSDTDSVKGLLTES